MQEDVLRKYTAYDDMVRVICIKSKELVEEARKIHSLNPTPTAGLGRTLTMGAIMGSMLKDEKENITIQIIGDGPLGSILVSSNNKANVKGYVSNPMAEAEHIRPGKLNVAGIVGKGTLTVIKDVGMKEPYNGMVPLVSGEIAEDFAYYFSVSEQTPSAVALGVLVDTDGSVNNAGGFLIQMLPNAEEDVVSKIEKQLSNIEPITTLLEKDLSLDEIVKLATGCENIELLEEVHPKYECDCSRERMERALITIGKKDLMELSQDESTTLECHFCNKKYTFSKEEILKLLEN